MSNIAASPEVQARTPRLADQHYWQLADETPPAQLARHREIARRYARRNGRRELTPEERKRRNSNIRNKELDRLLVLRYGEHLPDDDAGRADLRPMLDHLVVRGEDHARRWAARRTPWMREDELDAVLEDVGPGKFWSPVALGRALNFRNEERRALDIRTFRPVDRTKKQLEQELRERNAERERQRRARAGAKPRAMSETQLKPWVAFGVSKSTYRRWKKAGKLPA